MYRDLLIYVGNVFSDYDFFEQLPGQVHGIRECLCVTAPREAALVLSVITPGCVIIDPDAYGENELRLLIKSIKTGGSFVFLYPKRKQADGCNMPEADGYINRRNPLHDMKDLFINIAGKHRQGTALPV